MIYKLFLFGEKELFAYTQIYQDMHLKEGDMFYFEEKREMNNVSQQQFAELEALELIITEVPAA